MQRKCNACNKLFTPTHANQMYCVECRFDDTKKENAKRLKEDVVNSPSHYTFGGIETIDYIQAKLTPEEFRGFLKGTIIKYTSRAGHKDDMIQDYDKAVWYINRLKKEVEK